MQTAMHHAGSWTERGIIYDEYSQYEINRHRVVERQDNRFVYVRFESMVMGRSDQLPGDLSIHDKN